MIVLLCGCSATTSSVNAITSGITFNAEILYNNLSFCYSVTINNGSETIMESVEDSELPLANLHFSGNSLNIRYENLEYKTEISSLPKGIILDFIHSVFLDAKKNDKKVILKDDEYFIEGKTQKYDYKIYFGGSGLPLKIVDTENSITAIISNAKVL